MAERRMFAKTIIDSDSFLDMPLSAQSLYFHLSMRADDEGFVNNPKKIQRMIGASEDDLKILIAKNFVIPFESGIVVIKHWRIHNYIRSDRLIETKYQDEKERLAIKENGSYSLIEEIKEIEQSDASDIRKMAYKVSSLPYSFGYKIKRAFLGKPCPVCGKQMTSSCKTSMPTIQHNTPISKGGLHELGNISIICESCNASIRNKETDDLNNAEVVETWDKIVFADSQKIAWFWNPKVLDGIDVSQMSVRCQSDVSIGKDSIDKDSIDKNSIKKNNSSADSNIVTSGVSKFKPPTLQDVSKYCAEKSLTYVNPESFIDFYESKNWMVGKNKMSNWKSALSGWNRRAKDRGEKEFGITIQEPEHIDRPERWRTCPDDTWQKLKPYASADGSFDWGSFDSSVLTDKDREWMKRNDM